MQSTVTLYHFVHPLWFDELGHFERSENICFFVEFVKIAFKCAVGSTKLMSCLCLGWKLAAVAAGSTSPAVFVMPKKLVVTECRHFGKRTRLWATFNEANVQAFCQYIHGRCNLPNA